MPSQESVLDVLNDMYTIVDDLTHTLPTLKSGMRSVLTGEYEFDGRGSILRVLMEATKLSLEKLIPSSSSEAGNLETTAVWKSYKLIQELGEDVLITYLEGTKNINSIIKKGKKLERKFGRSGPPLTERNSIKEARREDLLKHLFYIEEAFESKLMYAYPLWSNILEGGVLNEKLIKKIQDLEKTVQKLKKFPGFEKNTYKDTTLAYSCGSRPEVKQQTMDYLSGKIDWDAYVELRRFEKKIIGVELDGTGLRVNLIDPEEYPTWDEFGGYEDIREGIKGWVVELERETPRVNKILMAGISGTGKTTLLRCALREATTKGFVPIYLLKWEGANIGALRTTVESFKTYLPGVKILAAKDDIEVDLLNSIEERSDTLAELENFEYPLITTVNPDIPVYGGADTSKGFKDSAHLRRFDAVFYFGRPNENEREIITKIISNNLNKTQKESEKYHLTSEDISEIVECSNKMPGAYIELLIKRRILYPTLSWSDVSEKLNTDLKAMSIGDSSILNSIEGGYN